MENRILNNITSLYLDDGLEIIEEIFKNNFPNYVQKEAIIKTEGLQNGIDYTITIIK